MKYKDLRIKLMNQILTGIKVRAYRKHVLSKFVKKEPEGVGLIQISIQVK